MPLQNRVSPAGEIFADPARGTFLGNRGGALHNDERRIVRQYASRRWIACVLEFRGRHHAAKAVGPVSIDAPLLRQVVQGLGFVEAVHLHRPFDRLAGPANHQSAIGLAGYRHGTPIDFRRKGPVDLDLGLASRLALRERGEIEKWKAHRTLHLEGSLASEEHRGRVRIDAFDCVPAVGGGIAEEREDIVLRVACLLHAFAFALFETIKPIDRGG